MLDNISITKLITVYKLNLSIKLFLKRMLRTTCFIYKYFWLLFLVILQYINLSKTNRLKNTLFILFFKLLN